MIRSSFLRPQPLRKSIALLLTLVATPLISPRSHGASYVWDGDTGTAGAQDGSGTWNTTNTNWINAGLNSIWADGNDATFGSGADGSYAVTMALNPSATSLVFNNSGYTLSAASAQTITVTTATASIVLAAGKTATIGSNVTVSSPVLSQNSAVNGGGTLVIESGGTLKNSGTANSNVLSINTATLEVKTGGSLLTSPVSGGNGNAIFVNGNLNVTGGTVSALGTLGIGQSSAAGTTSGTLTINSGTVAATSTNGIRIGATSGTTPGGTVNLNGGTLTAAVIFKGAAGVTNSIVNLNGGTLQASATTATFMQGLARANVRDGGAIIDTNGRNITIGQALEHSNIGGDNATDGGLTKLGLGTLTLTGINTYTGGTKINAGTLQFGVGALPASGAVTINAAGTLTASGPFSTVTDWLTAGNISTTSTGSIALTADSAESISMGAFGNLMLGASTNSIYTGTLTPGGTTYHVGGGGATLTLANTNALTGARNVVVGATGSTGTVVLANANDYTGGTTINSGTLSVSDDSNLGSTAGALTFNGGILQVTGATFTSTPRSINWGAGGGGFDIAGGNTFSVNQSLLSGGGLTKSGNGTLVLNGGNTYTGVTTLNAGILQLGNSTALGTSTLTNILNNAQLQLSDNVTVANAIRLGGPGLNNDGILKNLSGNNTLTDFGIAAVIGTRINVVADSTLNLPNAMAIGAGGGVQNVRLIGSGTLSLGGNNSAVIGAANSFLLGLGSSAGPTVRVGNDLAFGLGTIDFQPLANATVTSNDAAAHTLANSLKFSDTFLNQITFGVAGTGNLIFTGAVTMAGNADVAIQNSITTLSGAISGIASLTKSGPGTLVLSGTSANVFSGGVFVSSGVLDVQKNGGLGTGDITVSDSATLKLELAIGNNYINDAGKLLLAVGSPVVNLAFTGAPDVIAALSFDGGNTFAAPGIWGSPASGAQFTNSVFTGTGTFLVVPEPGTGIALLASATALLGLRRRRS